MKNFVIQDAIDCKDMKVKKKCFYAVPIREEAALRLCGMGIFRGRFVFRENLTKLE